MKGEGVQINGFTNNRSVLHSSRLWKEFLNPRFGLYSFVGVMKDYKPKCQFKNSFHYGVELIYFFKTVSVETPTQHSIYVKIMFV